MTLPQLFSDLTRALASPRRYARRYRSEAFFEKDVWRIIRRRCKRHFGPSRLSRIVLTSHTGSHGPEERAAWAEFLRSKPGPDVRVLGSNNRLDIVVKHPRRGSIGIEVKCLSSRGHAGKLTQGLGQAVLALANRHLTLLLIHCGAVPSKQQRELRTIARRICQGSRTRIIVVP
jgi:hypothetical protein